MFNYFCKQMKRYTVTHITRSYLNVGTVHSLYLSVHTVQDVRVYLTVSLNVQ